MQRWLTGLILVLSVLLAGCASTVQSNVTAFHEWPADLRDKSFVFERSKDQENNLEHRSYENLARSELQRLGFAEAADVKSTKLKISMRYGINARDVRIIEPVAVDPFWDGYGPGFYGPRWRGYGYHSPFYDPFWYAPAVQQRETSFQLFMRHLRIVISQTADSKKLYDVTVTSDGRNGSLAAVMPYMVSSAFSDFPGKNGVPRRVDLKIKD